MFFSFFPENKILHFMLIVSLGAKVSTVMYELLLYFSVHMYHSITQKLLLDSLTAKLKMICMMCPHLKVCCHFENRT